MTDLNVNEKAIFAYLGVTSRDEICAYASLSSNDDRYILGLYRKVDVYSIPEYPRNSWDIRGGSKAIEFTATHYYAKYGDWIGEFGNFDHLCRYAKTLDKAYEYANTSAMTVAEMVAASELKTSDIRLTNLRHDYVNKLNIHLVDNSTITRQITNEEAREYFALNNDIAKQRQYVAELFNREYRQPQPKPSRSAMSVDEERYSFLAMQRKDNALPTTSNKNTNNSDKSYIATTTNERDKLTVIDNAKWRDCATANGRYEIQRTTYDSVGRVTMTETIAEADSVTVQAQTLLINSAHLLAEHYRQQATTQHVSLEFTPQCAARIAVWYSAFVTEPTLIIKLNIKLS